MRRIVAQIASSIWELPRITPKSKISLKREPHNLPRVSQGIPILRDPHIEQRTCNGGSRARAEFERCLLCSCMQASRTLREDLLAKLRSNPGLWTLDRKAESQTRFWSAQHACVLSDGRLAAIGLSTPWCYSSTKDRLPSHSHIPEYGSPCSTRHPHQRFHLRSLYYLDVNNTVPVPNAGCWPRESHQANQRLAT